jgi:hypothetical protein
VLATESGAHISAVDFIQYRDRNQTFAGLAASHIGGPTRVRWDGPTQMIPVTPVTGNYFELLGVTAALGRTLTPADAEGGRSESVVLSDAGWRRFFRSDSHILGTTVFLDGAPHAIVGVLPEWFTGTLAPMVPQIYRVIPERADGLVFPSTMPQSFRRLLLIGRLEAGVAPAQARADLQRIATQLTAQDHQPRVIEVYPARTTNPFVFRAVLVVALMFAVIVGVVLLITCDNIAILTTLRSAARSREMAVRLALGASRWRIVSQVVVETALLCGAAGVVATYLAFVTARFATQFYVPVPMPFALTFKPDWRVIAFAILISSVAVVLCGLVPALKTLKTDLVTTLKGTGLGQGVQAGLVVIQMALSTALLVSAGVLAHSAMTGNSQTPWVRERPRDHVDGRTRRRRVHTGTTTDARATTARPSRNIVRGIGGGCRRLGASREQCAASSGDVAQRRRDAAGAGEPDVSRVVSDAGDSAARRSGFFRQATMRLRQGSRL